MSNPNITSSVIITEYDDGTFDFSLTQYDKDKHKLVRRLDKYNLRQLISTYISGELNDFPRR